ncbi:MAG: hypothetical protein IID44_13900 [Planctomycetes bacterium]|nr:hypothetical protein [Planctomycetota bacterium]
MKRPHTSRRLRLEFLEHRRLLSTISGTLWNDLDGDAIRQSSESGLSDRDIYLDANDNARLDDGEMTATTDAAGGYVFTDLPEGDYTVRQVLQPGWEQTSPAGIQRAEVFDLLAMDNPFHGANQVQFGPDGNLYMVGAAGVLRYDGATGELIDRIVAPGFSAFRRLTFGPDGNLYFYGGRGNNCARTCIQRFDLQTGQFIDNFIDFDLDPTVLGRGLTFGPDGDLYVANMPLRGNVLRFDGATGEYLGEFVPDFSGGLTNPSDLTFGPSGDLFVTFYGGGGGPGEGAVFRYDGSTGAFRGEFVTRGSGGLGRPASIAFGPDGHLYVSDRFTGRVLRYNGRTGAFIDVYVPDRPNLNAPAITFDSSGNLYLPVPDEGIVRFQGPLDVNPGALIDVFSQPLPLNTPADFAFGPDGNVYVVSRGGAAIERFDPATGQYLGTFVSSGSGGLSNPIGLTWGADDNLYVSNGNGDQILRYDGKTGAFLDAFVTKSNGGLDYPVGITFGPDGDLYVTSANTSEILRYDGSTGAFESAFVSEGSGGLRRPAELIFAPDGSLYVSSYDSRQVIRYDGQTGEFLDVFVDNDPSNIHYGLEFGPDGNLYTGGWFGRYGVQRFDGRTGALIDVFIPRGFGDVGDVSYLHFGPDGLLYVSARNSGLHRFELIDRGWNVSLGAEQNRRNINFGSRRTGTDSAEDLTGNGFVDFEDLTVLLANWNQNVGAASGNLVDPGGSPVNFEDLTVLLAAWTGPGGAAAPPAPPAALVGRRLAAASVADQTARADPINRVTPTLRRLQAAAVDRAMVEDFAHERELIARRRTPSAPSADA